MQFRVQYIKIFICCANYTKIFHESQLGLATLIQARALDEYYIVNENTATPFHISSVGIENLDPTDHAQEY